MVTGFSLRFHRASDWLKNNKHSEIVLSVRGFVSFTVFFFFSMAYLFFWLLTSSVSSNLATYDWPLSKLNSNKKFRELITGREATIEGLLDDSTLHSTLGVATREGTPFINLGNSVDTCLGNLELCENGLSVGLWMNYRGQQEMLTYIVV